MGVIGSAKLLQALARDKIVPGLTIFGQGTKIGDEPTYAIFITYVVAQLTMLCDINQIASFVTMTYLMTFLVTNLACFLLKISSAPNFRPSFRYFNWQTAAFGTVVSGASMFFVDGVYASACVAILLVLFLVIHYFTPPKSWGDVSQSLIYHQVRKYLLRLRQEHVKFWRPQILLLVNDPRRSYKLIQFCNSLKKGALFVLGHVIVSSDFGGSVPEARRQQAAWTKYIDFSRVKAFVNIAIAPAAEWGTRNIVLNSGLGGMRPNIVVMGFFNLDHYRKNQPLIDVPPPQKPRTESEINGKTTRPTESAERRDSKLEKMKGDLPTDICKSEGDVTPASYLIILEDLLLRLQINVAIAKGFKDLQFPRPHDDNSKKYIDLWPIQMSAELTAEGEKSNVLTTNFDTYTLILQLGCILNTVPDWKKAYKLRVAVFVEYESDVEEERTRVQTLLANLRIKAEVLVFWLASGHVKSYQAIVNGEFEKAGDEVEKEVDEVLKDEEWWHDIQKIRGRRGELTASEELANIRGVLNDTQNWPQSAFRSSRQESNLQRFEGLRKFLRRASRRRSTAAFGSLGGRLSMTTHRLQDEISENHAAYASASEGSESEESSFYDSDDDASKASAASENDLSTLEGNRSKNASRSASPSKLTRRRSDGESLRSRNTNTSPGLPGVFKSDTFKSDNKSLKAPPTSSAGPSTPATPGTAPLKTPLSALSQSSSMLSPTAQPTSHRPRATRRSSAQKFSSLPVPNTALSTEEGPGPSIMFTEPEVGRGDRQNQQSIYDRKSTAMASGFPAQQGIPLTFNDLPCRAQHLILNELIKSQSPETAVVFTTLPSPMEGTSQSEEESLIYLSDLEVLCEGLPPLLLIHSNSMTVTTNL